MRRRESESLVVLCDSARGAPLYVGNVDEEEEKEEEKETVMTTTQLARSLDLQNRTTPVPLMSYLHMWIQGNLKKQNQGHNFM